MLKASMRAKPTLPAVLILVLWLGCAAAEQQRFTGSLPAIEFPETVDWLNVDEPLTLAELRGKIVILDFWTYGCINCIHVIPELHSLEEKYSLELVVIGVHSGKFDHERETENIRRINERYGRTHPVVNDRDFEIWRSYGIRAWPSFIIIDPEGMVLGHHAGEGIYELFDEVLTGMVEVFEARGTLDRRPLEIGADRPRGPASPLRFPGKVLADEEGEILYIADSNHHRVVVTDLGGRVLEVIGSGESGFADGDVSTARFLRPQGLALADPGTLFVADTGNHSIRRVDLASGTVTTAAGIGRQVYMHRIRSGPARTTGLNSPWDVLYHDGQLYIAMAGQHQLWRYDPSREMLYHHAGTAIEELVDGPLPDAGLNQPSGLATDGRILYVADSEASAVRAAEFDTRGRLDTIVGTGLFDFGDVDGIGDAVRLQHPKGVTYHEGHIYIADTYNNKIKRLDPVTRESVTFLGEGKPGWKDGAEPLFYEPAGLSIAAGKLFIADTNNHAIRVAELATGEVRTLALRDELGLLTVPPGDAAFQAEEVWLAPRKVAAGPGKLMLTVGVPDGYRANDLAPLSLDWRSDGAAVHFGGERASRSLTSPDFPVTLEFPVDFAEGEATLTGELTVYYCREGAEALCLIEQVHLKQPVTVRVDGADTLHAAYHIPLFEDP